MYVYLIHYVLLKFAFNKKSTFRIGRKYFCFFFTCQDGQNYVLGHSEIQSIKGPEQTYKEKL